MRLTGVAQTVDMTVEELVSELVEARASLRSQEASVYYLERAVAEGMQERGATVVKISAGEATLTTPVSYDYGILARLREITSPDDLVGYTPEREIVKVEPERWNMTQAKTLAKLSHDHSGIIEDAKIYGNPKVKFTAKKGA
jgi:phosphoserine phosphatase